MSWSGWSPTARPILRLSLIHIYSSSSSKANKQALSQLKNEVASELGITLKQGYNGDITSREAGRIGGNITRRVIEEMESQMSGR